MPKTVGMKSVYSEKVDSDGRRILITRYYPRGVKRTHFDDWIRELAPSRDLLKQYKDGKISWKVFEMMFVREMRCDESMGKIRELSSLAETEPITLLCYERNDHDCHRHLVRDLVMSTR